MSNAQESDAKLLDSLYQKTKRGTWKAVVEIYKKEGRRAQRLLLTVTQETALHLAAMDNQEEVVVELVQQISTHENKDALEMTNDRGDTPLHIAAALGSVIMCNCIARLDNSLVDKRNEDGETPLFLAALHANKEAFYCLYHYCNSDLLRINPNCRRNDGDTIVHCALNNEQLDLAFHIISMNKEAVDWVDGQGLTALHLLAARPTVFKSGCDLYGWREIVYYYTSVKKLKAESVQTNGQSWKRMLKPKKADKSSNFPDNYATCIQLFTYLRDGFLIVKGQAKKKGKDEENLDGGHGENEGHGSGLLKPEFERSTPSMFPENYSTCFNFFDTIFKGIMTILGYGSSEIKKIRDEKQKHCWSVQVMEELVKFSSLDKYKNDGNTPDWDSTSITDQDHTLPYKIKEGDVISFDTENYVETIHPKPRNKSENDSPQLQGASQESAILIAAKNGVIEMVRGVYEHFPLAIRDINRKEEKNVLHFAAEYRQPEVFEFLVENRKHLESMFRALDNDGNSALHLAATTPKAAKHWRITGTALQMQWEVKWYLFVKESVAGQFSTRKNKDGKTPDTIFHESHKELVEEGEKWLSSSSESCSVVAALIATVAFASAATVPGGNNENGYAILQKQGVFFIYAISSLIALSLSSTSVIIFLAVLTARSDFKDFGSNLSWKLFMGLSSLYLSIIAMLVSFGAGHFFLLSHRLQNYAVLLYILIFLPIIIFFPMLQLPLYYDLFQAISIKVPKRRAHVILSSE